MPTNDDYWNRQIVPQQPTVSQQAAPDDPLTASVSAEPASRQEQQYRQAQPQQCQEPQQPQQLSQYQQAQQYRYQAQAPAAAATPGYAPVQTAATPGYAPAQKKSHGWIVAIVVVVCLFAFTAFCVKSCNDAVANFGGSYASADLSGDTIALINLDGTIQYDGSACSPEGFKELLDEAEADDHIKALVIRVNSGGGTATAGEEMAEYLKDFSKPVVVSSASINASAAYEISAQADRILAARSTEIGAIGTAMELTDLSGLLDMLGVNMEVITSADSKDSSYGYRPLTDEERAYYQDMVDKINEMFIENVMEGRGMTEEQVRAVATGMPFTGEDAIKNGLADAIGTREDAFDMAAELAGISDYDTYELCLSDYDWSTLSGLLGKDSSSVEDLVGILERAQARGASV